MVSYSPGLAGVPAAKSKISFLDGQKGILEYRGFPIEVLAEKSNFLEISWLLLFGNLPTQAEIRQFSRDLVAHRQIKYRIKDMMKCLPDSGHPMDALQAAIAALGMFYPAKDVMDPRIQYDSAVRLIAKMPTIIAAHARMRHGDEPISPRADLNHGANFLYMLTGREPEPLMGQVLDTALILHAEHTMNASTFSGLVTASTLADAYSVVSSAIGTLSGPLHGGASEAVVGMFREIGRVENVRSFLEKRLADGKKIMGLGHREYKVRDPRAGILEVLAKKMYDQIGNSDLYEIAMETEKVGTDLLLDKKVFANVDFFSGIVYEKMGIDKDLFTPVFAMARVTGWLAHWIEQLKGNQLFRPTEIYEGDHNRPFVPIQERS